LPDEEKKDKSSREQKGKRDLGREVKWSSPEKKEASPESPKEKKGIKSYLPDFFNADFLKKKKERAGVAYTNNLPDRNKLGKSRRELLKLIGEQKKAASYPPVAGRRGETKASPTKKKRLEIMKLFKPMVAVFKKFGKKPKADGGREEKEQRREQPSGKEGASKKEVAPEFTQVKDEREREGTEVLETSLIKGEITVFFNWRKNVVVLIVCMILAALAVGLVYSWLSWQGRQKEKEGQYFIEMFFELDKEITRIEEEAKKVLVFKKKLSLVSSLLGQHVYWTNFFKFLEENTLADVYYSGFSGDDKGKYNLAATGKGFSIIHAQVERFLSSEYVSEASVGQAGISGAEKKEASEAGETAFELKLVIDPAIFTSVK